MNFIMIGLLLREALDRLRVRLNTYLVYLLSCYRFVLWIWKLTISYESWDAFVWLLNPNKNIINTTLAESEEDWWSRFRFDLAGKNSSCAEAHAESCYEDLIAFGRRQERDFALQTTCYYCAEKIRRWALTYLATLTRVLVASGLTQYEHDQKQAR